MPILGFPVEEFIVERKRGEPILIFSVIRVLRFWFCVYFCIPMADVFSIVPAAVLRNLSDKLYEKRKNAALEVFNFGIFLGIFGVDFGF